MIDRGTLRVIDNQVDQTTGTVKLKAEFPNAGLQLWPGQFVNVRLLIDTLKDVVVIPTGAVQRGPNGTFVYVVKDDNTAAMRPIVVQKQDETQTVVKSGVTPPERVVTTGFVRLTDGSKVTIGSASGAPAAAAQGRNAARATANANGQRRRQAPAAMSVSSPFIHRPIATSLLGIAVMLGGALGYWWLPVSALPQVDFPTIQVTTQLPGASPDTIASLVTAPLERQFGQIPALQTMTSASSFGISQVTLQFDLNRDIDAAAQDVQSAINAAGSTLPRNLPYPPLYSKVNPADAPIITLALTSQTIDLRALERHGRHHHGAAAFRGDRRRPRLGAGRHPPGDPHPGRSVAARAYGIALEDLRTAIVGANVAGAKGSLDGAHQSYTIAANDQITAAETYKNVVVAFRNGAPVKISDVADVIDGLENTKVGASYRGQPAIVVDVQRQPGANVIDTVSRVRAELPRLRRAMPAGAKLTIVNDRTTTIRASIHDVQFTLMLSRGAGRAGGADLPAHRARHHHRRRGAAAVADRHLRRDVVCRLLARQSVADGADHRHRLRGRRRHRDDREHRAPHGERRKAARRGVARRQAKSASR